MTTIAQLRLVADADIARAEAQLAAFDRAIQARNQAWSRTTRSFVDDADRQAGSLGRLARAGEDSHRRLGRSIDLNISRHLGLDRVLGTVASQLTRMGARAAIIAGPMTMLATAGFQVGAALTPLVGLAGALPGLLGAGALAAGAGALAFAGMGDALKAMTAAQDGTAASQAKLREAMAALPPAARPVARELFGMRGLLDQLRTRAAAGIFPGVDRALDAARRLFPIVREQVGRTADVIGRLARTAATWAESPLFRRDLAAILGESAQVTQRFGWSALLLGRALVGVGAEARPLVRWVGDLAQRGAVAASNFLTAARESGAMGRFFAQARDRAEQLGRILFNVVRIILNLGQVAAPAGGRILDVLEAITARGAAASGDIDRLRARVMAAADAFVVLKGALLGAALGPWGMAAGAVAGGLVVLYRRSEAFRSVVNAIGAELRERALPIFQALSGWVTGRLIPAFARAIPFVRDQLMAGFRSLSGAVQDNRTEFAQVGRIILRVVDWIATSLAPWLLRLYAVYLRGLMTALGLVIREFGDTVRAIGRFIGWVQDAIRWVRDFAMRARTAYADFRRSATDAMTSVGRSVTDGLRAARRRIEEWGNGVVAWLRGRRDALYSTGRSMWQGLVDGIRSIDLIGTLRRIVGGAIDWVKRILKISSPSQVMYDIGRNMMLGVAGGIRDNAPDIFEGFLDKISPDLLMRAISGLRDLPANLLRRLSGLLGGALGGGGGGSAYRLVGNALEAFGVFRRLFPWMTIGGWRARGSVPGSDHPKGLALDLMTTSNLVAQTIIRIFRSLDGAKYWIWNRRIATAAGGWGSRPYGGPNPHTDHVHLSFFREGAWKVLRDTLGVVHRGELVMPTSVAEPFRAFVDRVATLTTGSRSVPALAGTGGGPTVIVQSGGIQVSLTGTYAEPITRADVHTAIAAALGQLQLAVVKGGRV